MPHLLTLVGAAEPPPQLPEAQPEVAAGAEDPQFPLSQPPPEEEEELAGMDAQPVPEQLL
jgi:hypothetical protein